MKADAVQWDWGAKPSGRVLKKGVGLGYWCWHFVQRAVSPAEEEGMGARRRLADEFRRDMTGWVIDTWPMIVSVARELVWASKLVGNWVYASAVGGKPVIRVRRA